MDMEAQYNNRARVPEHPAIFVAWQRDAATYRQQALCELDVPYGDGSQPRHVYDLFLPQSAPARGVFLFIHGGYWQGLDKGMFSHFARVLNARGFAVAMANYRLCPDVSVADIVDEMLAASLHLAERFGQPITVFGHSAGGHLAACVLAANWESVRPGLAFAPVKAACGLSGLYDLPPLVQTSVNNKLGLDEAMAHRLSPAFWPAPVDKSFAAFVGETEPFEYQRQSQLICDVWGKGGARTQLHVQDSANHFTILEPLLDENSRMIAVLTDLAAHTPTAAAI